VAAAVSHPDGPSVAMRPPDSGPPDSVAARPAASATAAAAVLRALTWSPSRAWPARSTVHATAAPAPTGMARSTRS
jgi:hypothetical protein